MSESPQKQTLSSWYKAKRQSITLSRANEIGIGEFLLTSANT